MFKRYIKLELEVLEQVSIPNCFEVDDNANAYELLSELISKYNKDISSLALGKNKSIFEQFKLKQINKGLYKSERGQFIKFLKIYYK